MPDPAELAKEALVKLERNSDPDRIEWLKGSCPTAARVLGVKASDLHMVDREFSARFKSASPEQVIQFAQSLVNLQVLECQQVAYEVLSRHKPAMSSIREKHLIALGIHLDNWVSTDYFGGLVAGPAWREMQVPDSLILSWAQSPDRWYRRTAAVCTVALNQKARGGTGDPDRTLLVCEYVAGDQDEMVSKALSWALRELAKREPDPAAAFINQNKDVLPARVTREVKRKLTTGRKY